MFLMHLHLFIAVLLQSYLIYSSFYLFIYYHCFGLKLILHCFNSHKQTDKQKKLNNKYIFLNGLKKLRLYQFQTLFLAFTLN